jgi:type 1 glutamine amidotransferase
MQRRSTASMALAIGMLFSGFALGTSLFAAGGADGFQPLFDGKSLDGWEGNPDVWRVEDGTITGETTADKPIKPNTFLIWRRGEVDDFELTFEYRFTSEKGNSGVQYRSWQEPDSAGKFVMGGYQADFETGKSFSGILYGERYRGILAGRGTETVIGDDHKPTLVRKFAESADLQNHVKQGDWNKYRVVAQGFKFTHEVNGQLMSVCTDQDKAQRRRSGLLGLQVHAGPPMKVQFRNILLKRLKLEDAKKVVFIAGRPSHGYQAHGHNPGCLMLAKMLTDNEPRVVTTVYQSGWPQDPTALDNADTVVIFSDGGGGHPAMPHLKELDALMKKGVGLACLHYAVEVPKGEPGNYFLNWIGGYFETDWSVNPHYAAEVKSLPQHPITRGVEPFNIDDEWYYHMRFRENMQGVTPILTCVPPDSTRTRPDGPHSNNPTVRAGKGSPEHIAWACERPDGGRGFGFTGGHWHWNWANHAFRTVVLNGIVWTAGLDVPQGGVPAKKPTLDEIKAHQDFPVPKNFDFGKVQKLIDSWK